MQQLILQALEANSLITVFLILALGIPVGRIRVAGVELGAVTGVLLVGMIAGHLDLPTPRYADNMGFILFIYGIGFEAGPRFIQAFRKDGLRYFTLAALVAISASGLALGASTLFDFDLGISSGVLGGALTSTPTLVAAQDAVAQGLELPAGVTRDDVLGNISAAYAITYVFGMAGLILFIGFFPRMVRIDLAAEARKLGEDGAMGEDAERYLNRPPSDISVRAYRIENESMIGWRLGERDYGVAGELQRVKRGTEVFVPDNETVLEQGDILVVVAPPETHKQMLELAGPEVIDHEILDRSVESQRILVASREIQGKTLAELDFSGNYRCWLTEISRGNLRLPRRPDLELQLGDVLTLTGARSKLDSLAEKLGFTESRKSQTDLFAFAMGIALGLFAGLFTIEFLGVRVGLGSAGGALMAGIVFGIINSYRPNEARFPAGARYILMELGLLLFMTGIGVSAGGTIVETFTSMGPTLAIAGTLVTVIPVIIAFVVGRYFLRMNGAILFGAITGSMTSTAALRQVQAQARSNIPALGYVGSYTFSNVLLAVAGAVLMRF